jgi:hypothetical protein
MLSTADLRNRLIEIENEYSKETDPIKMLLWAKLALLEVSGWTEECIDKIVKDYLAIKNPPSKQKILEKLNRIYGFHYASEFKGIWVTIIGNILFDKIEQAKPAECQKLESALNMLKKSRDVSAHTYTKTTSAVDAPTIAISRLQQIESGLLEFWNELLNVPI